MSDPITTAEALDALPPDDARTAWEREALDRFLRSSPDIPPHIFKHFEVALWGACHVLLLMRPDSPSDLRAEIEALAADPFRGYGVNVVRVSDLRALLAAHPVQVTTGDAIARAKAEAWDEGYWQGINGHTGPGNPYRVDENTSPRAALDSEVTP